MGGKGNDKLYGEDGNDTIYGDEGADYIDGGAGTDTVNYEFSTAAVSVNLAKGVGKGGFAEGDKYVSIENVMGSNHDDKIVGDAANNRLYGMDGDDLLDGGKGSDHLYGGKGNDTLIGGDGNDYLFGGVGDDLLRPGSGADYVDGGDGIDTVDYSDAPLHGPIYFGNLFGVDLYIPGDWGVFVDLERGQGAFSDAEGDTFVGVENIRGSAYDDILLGNDQANAIYGGAGDDWMMGGGGGDYLDGGAGTDTVSYERSSAGVVIDLRSNGWGPVVYGGDATGDTLVSIENVIGSDHDDRLYGSSDNNTLIGGAGDDIINGGAGGDRIEGGWGNDTLIGGAGADTFVFTFGDHHRGDGIDTILDFEVGVDRLEFHDAAPFAGGQITNPDGSYSTVIAYAGPGGDLAFVYLQGVQADDLALYWESTVLWT